MPQLKEAIKRNWIESSESIDVLEQRVCDFLEIPDIRAEPKLSYAARKTAVTDVPYAATSPAMAAWLKRAKHLANKTIKAEKYSVEKLESALRQLKLFLPNDADVRRIPRLYAEAGVRFLVVEHLPQTRVDGATFWINEHSPVIVLSLRYDRLDNFWHTFLHETKHVLNGDGKETPCIDEDIESSDKPESEKAVDAWAASFSIDQAAVYSFINRTRPYFSPVKIIGFAAKLNVHPAIAAGQVRYKTGNHSIFSKVVSSAKIKPLLLDSVVCDGWGQVLPAVS
jgi:HTH-type transcriptional regulator/antitoxin HigA